MKTALNTFETGTDKLFGIYRGVIEDRKDPLRLGRVRVRIWGVHTEEQEGDYNKAPWDELQWAHPVNSTFGGSISDVGAWHIPLQGSHVMIFFENGNLMQPRYFATVPGFPIDGDKFSQFEKQDGFRDPDEEYPLDDHIPEHDWHRLARIDKLAETYLELKDEQIDEDVDVAFGGAWDEQPPMYEAEYPDNNVWATQEEFDLNQVFELDSTIGKQRIQYWHPSMSYFEINKDGLMTLKNSWHRWDICKGQKMERVWEDHHMHVDMNVTTYIGEAEWREIFDGRWTAIFDIDWKFTLDNDEYWVIGDTLRFSLGDHSDWALGDGEMTVLGDRNVSALGTIKHASFSSIEQVSVSSFKIVSIGGRASGIIGNDTVNATGNILHTSTGVIHQKASANIVSEAPMIYVNASGGAALVGGAVAVVQSPIVGIGSGIVYIGPTVYLGVTPPSVSPQPAIPAPPVFLSADVGPIPGGPSDPPSPYEPEEFPREDVPIEMPIPGC